MVVRRGFQGAGERVYLSIGFYDGVHRGHRRVLQTMVGAARNAGARATLITFVDREAEGTRKDRQRLLTVWAEKRPLLDALKIELVNRFTFNRRFRALTPDDFFSRLAGVYRVEGVIVGEDFAFGRDRSGTTAWLARNAQRWGYQLEVVPHVYVGQARVSSSRIREAVARGDIAEARLCLGRYPTICGRVGRGDGRGKRLGFPTANLAVPPRKLVPAAGVYASRCRYGGRLYRSMLHVGPRPTYDAEAAVAEAHLLGFSGDLQGQMLTVELIQWLRPVVRFQGNQALIRQLEKDRRTTIARVPLRDAAARIDAQ